MLKRPLTLLLLSFTAGICTSFYNQSRYLLFVSLFMSSVLFIATFYKMLRKENCLFSPLFLFYFLGILSFYPHMIRSDRDDNILRFASNEKVEIVGVVEEFLERDNRKVAVLNNIIADGVKVKGKLRVSIGGKVQIRLKDYLKFSSVIREIRNYSNPGGFNYKRFLYFKNIYARTYVNGKKIKITETGEEGIFEKLRGRILKIIDKSDGNIDSKAVLKTLTAGERNIPAGLRDIFNRTGTGHILAVSGLHMGIIASFFYFIAKFFFSFFNTILKSGNLKRISALFTVPAVLFYGVLCGMSPSTQRAIIMVLIFVLSLQLKKETDLLNIISAAALTILIIDPAALFSISFQLSFTAVIFITVSLRLKIHKRYSYGLYGKFLSFATVTFFASIGTSPLVAHYFQQISISGFFANLLIVPVFSFLILPLGLISVISGLFIESVGIYLAGIDLKILDFLIDMLKSTSDFKYSAILSVKPDLLEIFLIYVIILSILMILFEKNKRIYLLILIFSSSASLLDLSCVIYQRYFRDDMRITFLDVGQGNSALVELPRGKTVLIDGGGFSSNRFFDIGKYVVAPFLLSRKILTIDTMILSHPNSDHMNGLIYIAENFNVKRLWSNGKASDTMSYRYLMKTLDINGIEHDATFRSKKEVVEGAILKVLYPLADFKGVKGIDSNADSLVLKIEYGEFSVLFPGDIEEKTERELAGIEKRGLKSTILLVPHHGSGTSSSIPFLKMVKPDFSVISSGYGNRFGFPAKKVVKRLDEFGGEVFRIDKKGAVIFDIGKNNIRYRFYNNN